MFAAIRRARRGHRVPKRHKGTERVRQSFAKTTAMRKVLEYEGEAAECRKLAAQMKIPEQRKRLEDMADVWDRLARERRQGIIENNPAS